MGEEKTPVERAITAFGGVEALAAVIGQSVHRVYRWRRETAKGGRGGRIPDDAQPLILRAARDRGLALSAEDLIDMRAPVHVRAAEDCQ